ncbi:MAG: dienelactone hydrolase family protein [Candidatus Obscuribacterales bacterium]|nr:dienelactone hydrolase family protein [Candidatus Obscuribacterales bacterium]
MVKTAIRQTRVLIILASLIAFQLPVFAQNRLSKIAGMDVAIWFSKTEAAPAPLVVFSHGYRGNNKQCAFILDNLSSAGYVVFAPNHADAIGYRGAKQAAFRSAFGWTDRTYKNRAKDLTTLLQALHQDPYWSKRIDWSKIALAGHSLGGYTVLGLAGAWPSWKTDVCSNWKISGIKAVLALSPYCQPFLNKNLRNIDLPVMYQGGTWDTGITPTLRGSHGAYSLTGAPAYFVEFDRADHFAWTNLNTDPAQKKAIDYYCLAFLDKYVKGSSQAELKKLSGVATFEFK